MQKINTNLHTVLNKYINNTGGTKSSHLTAEQYQLAVSEIQGTMATCISQTGISLSPVECGMWINHYNIGDSNEMHNHITANGPVYVAIVILDTGTDEELVIYDGSTPVVHTPTAGEVYLLPGEVMHGLNAVKDRLTAFMIMYSINQ